LTGHTCHRAMLPPSAVLARELTPRDPPRGTQQLGEDMSDFVEECHHGSAGESTHVGH